MARRRTKVKELPMYGTAQVPLKRGTFRDPRFVQAIVLRMGTPYITKLDKLCEINGRSRREIIEMMIDDRFYDWDQDNTDRIIPLND